MEQTLGSSDEGYVGEHITYEGTIHPITGEGDLLMESMQGDKGTGHDCGKMGTVGG